MDVVRKNPSYRREILRKRREWLERARLEDRRMVFKEYGKIRRFKVNNVLNHHFSRYLFPLNDGSYIQYCVVLGKQGFKDLFYYK